LLACFSDTKLVSKSILGELNLADLYLSKLGRRIPLYLLTPRSKRHFIPSTVQLLAYHDAARALTSKKDPAVRTSELRKAVSPGLIKVLEEEGGALVRDPGASLLAGEVLLYAEGVDKLSTIEPLISSLLIPYKQTYSLDPDPTDPSVHTIDFSYSSRLFKLLLQAGHHSFATKSIEVVEGMEPYALAFAEAFWRKTSEAGTLVPMACGGGAFVVTECIERLKIGGSELVKEVGEVFGEDEIKAVRESGAKGAKVLEEKLESCRSA
jgi:pumilio family protein 6